MKMVKAAFTAALSLAVSTNTFASTAAHTFDPTKSQALNFALAVGLTTPDKGPLGDSAAGSGLPDSSVQQGVSRGLDGAIGGYSAATGGSPGLGALGLISFLLSPSGGKHPAGQQHFYGYIPASLAGDSSQAKKVMEGALADAMARGLAGTFSAAKETVGTKGMFQNSSREDIFLTGGDVCGKLVACRLHAVVFVLYGQSTSAPAFVANCSAGCYVTERTPWGDAKYHETADGFYIEARDLNDLSKDVSSSDLAKVGVTLPKISRADIVKASAFMPPWIYVYLPPDSTGATPEVLHAGYELKFICPGTTAQNGGYK